MCMLYLYRRTLQRTLKKQGLDFMMNTKVTEAIKMESGRVQVKTEAAKGGKEEVMEGDVLLVCIGRRAFTDGLGLEVCNLDYMCPYAHHMFPCISHMSPCTPQIYYHGCHMCPHVQHMCPMHPTCVLVPCIPQVPHT